MEQRQLSTNQLFEELLLSADKDTPDPVTAEEDAVLEAALSQVRALFNERATRIEAQTKENERIKSRHLVAVTELEQSILEEQNRLEKEHEEKVFALEAERNDFEERLEITLQEKAGLASTLEAERKASKEVAKGLKREVFDLEGRFKKLEDERSQLYRQNQSLVDMVEDLKGRTRRSDHLEEENQRLHLEVQILRREKEAFEIRLEEQIELAILRERSKTETDR
ncbi:hypothetical protein EVJ29_13075 [Exiguobacterium sp. SH4S7]|uniref:hypothetical protein n=1 Tax=Exiguobacterium sp. SH4S7 TaxID=2510958 RepID=UPI00103A966D|nr:hypothetical protein [Exiguobacterium sp. SH4S7]TCI33816.1 hypothetical protein EVJ29_13075 [Exiguobacterium sp. SH4S7]